MKDIFRDSTFGDYARFFTRNRTFLYPEEKAEFVVPTRYLLRHAGTDGDSLRTVVDTPKKESLQGEEANVGIETAPLERGKKDLEREDTKVAEEVGEKKKVDDLEKQEEPSKDIVSTPDPFLVDWYDENDQENPQNWSFAKKCVVTSAIMILTFSVYIGSAIYSPSIPGVMERFHVSYVRGVLGLSLFVIGYGIGPLFLSPLSEIPAIGRNPPYIYTLLLFVIFQIPTFTTSNYETLMTFRFLTGFVGSPALATGGASMADIWPGIKLPYVIALWAVGAVLGPVLGPVVGGFAAQNNGYKWPLYELIWICGFSCILLIFILPETYAPKILLKRAQRLRKLTGNNKLRSQSEIDQANLTLGEIASEALLKPFQLMMEPAVLFINVYLGLTYSIFYLWFEAFPIVFGEIYHFNLGEQGLPFVGFAITCMLSFAVYAAAQKYIYEPRFMRNGTIIPEERLEVGLVCCFFIPVSLFFYGWSSRESVHWIAPIIAAALYMPGIFLMFQVCLIYLPMSYPRYQASVLAGNDFFRSCMAGCFPLFGRALFKNLGVGPGCSLLAGLEIGLIPVLYLFYFKGAQFRSWSKYAQSS